MAYRDPTARDDERNGPLSIYRCMTCGRKFESEEELGAHRSQGHPARV